MYIKYSNKTDLQELSSDRLTEDVNIIVERDILTKPKYKYDISMLLSRIHSQNLYIHEIIEIERDNSKDADESINDFFDSIYDELGEKPSHKKLYNQGFMVTLSKKKEPIKYISHYQTDNEKVVILKKIPNTHFNIEEQIFERGVEAIYAFSVTDDSYVSIEDVAKLSGGRALVLKDNKAIKSEDGYKYQFVGPKQLNLYPVITDIMFFDEFPFPKVTDLKKGSLLINGDPSAPTFCRPTYVDSISVDTCLSTKIMALTLSKMDLEYAVEL